MKIAHSSPDKLILTHMPVMIGLLFVVFIVGFVGVGLAAILEGIWIGLFFMMIGTVLGGAGFIAYARKTQLSFDRESDTFVFAQKSVLGFQKQTYLLRDVVEATVESNVGPQGATVYRPAIAIHDPEGDATLPLSRTYTYGQGSMRTAQIINDWLG